MKSKWVAVVLAAVLYPGMQSSAQGIPPQSPAAQPGDQVSQPPRIPSLNSQLMKAVAAGQVEEVRALLTAGANTNGALMAAALYGQAEIFSILMDAGAPLAGGDFRGADCLRMALFSSNKKVRERTAKEQAHHLAEGKTAFQDGGGYNEIIKILLEHGVSAETPDEMGVTPLLVASMSGNEVAAGLLLEHGASADTENKTDGLTALQQAAWGGHGKIVELLLEAGASPDKADSEKKTPLLQAACAGSSEASVVLMGIGETKDVETFYNTHGHDYVRAVRALLKAGADPNLASKTDLTPLMITSAAGNLDIAKALLDAGADPNLRDRAGRTALMFAAKSEQPALVELLLSKQADPRAVALDGKTALSIAKGGKSRETVKLLQKSLKS